MGIRVGLIGFLMLIAASAMVESAIATDYIVGDDYGWDVPPNNSSDFYASWAARYDFKVGDGVVFNWTGNHAVMEVTEAGYGNCNKSDGLSPIVGVAGARITLPLTSAGFHYFICSVGTHCEQGQKVTLNATEVSSAPVRLPASALSAALAAIAMSYFFSF